MNRIKSIITTIVFAVLFLIVCTVCVLKPADEYSAGERRVLAQMPSLTVENVLNGEFMLGFEKYTVDQFPLRDKLRQIKALFVTEILKKKDNNKLFEAEGHISKIDDEMDSAMIDYAVRLFADIKDKYFENSNVYFSIIPDKNMFLAEKNGYPVMDYDAFIDQMTDKADFMEYIDIIPYLSLDDYYLTDTHWKQECIGDIAEFFADSMGVSIKGEYEINRVDKPFYGVYYGQSALPHKGDVLNYVTNDVIDGFNATYFSTGEGKAGEIYNMDKAMGKDMYEIFLSGSEPLVKIENPKAENDKRLVLFRDSFGGSLAPMLAQGYSEVYVADIRYMQSSMLGNFIDFDGCDVLFLYSTSVLNTSTSMR